MMADNANTYQIFVEKLGKIIAKEMRAQGIDQTELAEKTGQSQPTISNITSGKPTVSVKTIFTVMETLGLDPLNEISQSLGAGSSKSEDFKESIYRLIHNAEESFIYDPEHIAFNGIRGLYHVYFHPTNPHDSKLLYGQLELTPYDHHCSATLQLKAEDADASPDAKTIFKTYHGYLFISLIQNAVYGILINHSIGEMCFLTFPYTQILNKGKFLECTMALAVTVSSGIDSRKPTVHRMFFSRKLLNEQSERLIGAQLLLNKSVIQISDEQYKAMCNSGAVSQAFIKCFNQHKTDAFYYEIEEDSFKQLITKNIYHFYDLCILREYSNAPQNNKINTSVISKIYHSIIRQL